MPTVRSGNKFGFAFASIVILIGAMLRCCGLSTELWFDEICSIRYVQPLHSAWGVLWSVHSDNKHHLIWLWIWLAGPNRLGWVYRLPSIVAGVILLPILFRVVCREFNRRSGVLALGCVTVYAALAFAGRPNQ